MTKPYLTITRGLPGSGKSTWADGIVKMLSNFVKVERDQMRQLHFKQAGKLSTEQEELVTRTQEALVRTYINAGVNVIVSDTNLPDRSVKRWQKIALELGVEYHVEDFRHVPLDAVLENNTKRKSPLYGGDFVPEAVIRDMHQRQVKGKDLTKEVVYTPPVELEIEPYVQPKDLWKHEAVIFDIDGTLAVMGDRSPYDGAKVWMDTPHPDVVEALRTYSMDNYIIIVSGRDEEYREVTEKWLSDNSIHFDFLYMRPTEPGNKREDSIIKYELFNKHIRPKNYRILGVYDDRHRVLRMWRKLGLTTFHVNGPDAGNF